MPDWFDAEVDALERQWWERAAGDPKVLFYGSSTFTLWHDIDGHFPAYNIVNHGFGGSTLADCLEYFDRLVTPVRPAAIILYAGDNDLDNGYRPESVVDNVRAFVGRKRDALGAVPLAYVSIKVSPARLGIMHAISYTNRLAERLLAEEPDARFLDITRRMVGGGMEPWRRCFSDDPLHMNATGYRLWGKSLSQFLSDLDATGAPLVARNPVSPPAWAESDGHPLAGDLGDRRPIR